MFQLVLSKVGTVFGVKMTEIWIVEITCNSPGHYSGLN